MLDVAARAPFPGLAGSRSRRDSDLLKLAREVEPAQPDLALELRGMALHESRAMHAARSVAATAAARDPWWVRAGRQAWSALVAYGEGRAQREILLLAERWETSRPEVARELRAACARRA